MEQFTVFKQESAMVSDLEVLWNEKYLLKPNDDNILALSFV